MTLHPAIIPIWLAALLAPFTLAGVLFAHLLPLALCHSYKMPGPQAQRRRSLTDLTGEYHPTTPGTFHRQIHSLVSEGLVRYEQPEPDPRLEEPPSPLYSLSTAAHYETDPAGPAHQHPRPRCPEERS